ncbi:penicillin acylase family protein [Costertonia aggregata]|uniref:Penicillin acylase family protein n=1 Tax=Costertonia aggregata TaxID=343403 RepID=A0A7H9ATP6_9FLAO|nr:penicillin acylase family protein [Costertonia aggregata]QLG46819.1 penicillin acylase family protein [Costertonia aggregata]
MKTVKKIGKVLLVLFLLLIVAGVFFVYHMKPEYDGEKRLVNLSQEVKVYYDTYGIPHIYGENEIDAFRALGYVHAQDRLWQMELLRRIASGGLSEVFGPDLIGTDKFFLSIGIDEASEKTVSDLDMDSEAIQLSIAYLDGINQFIKDGPTPLEFYLTGIKKTDFSLKDIFNTAGYMAFSFAMAHKTDPFLTNVKDKLGVDYLADLEIVSNVNTEWIKNYKKPKKDSIGNNITAMVTEALGKLNIPLFEGSNSWAIAPEKTKNGKVIFANDPHIGFAQPSVWYEAHLETPTYSKYGYHIAGVPFPLLGHNRELAYGLTMFENDDVDFYYEEIHPSNENQYRTKNGWATFETVNKTIKVKDSGDISFSYKKSKHGPILNGIADQIKGDRPIAMSWIYTQMENTIIDAFYEMAHAQNLNQFTSGLPKIHAPGLNIMYGDAQGNVAWFATAKLYSIPDSIHTKFVYEPTEGLEINKQYLDFPKNPQAINPPWHYVYSANNQPDSIAGMLYPGYYLPENRAKRIVALLEPKNDWDLEATSNMITDVTSTVNTLVVKDLIKEIDVKKLTDDQIQLLDRLNIWQGDYPLESTEATFYTRWIYYFLESTFKDELGQEMFDAFLNTHLHKRLIAPMAKKNHSIWYDNVETKDKVETKKTIVHNAFVQSITSLEKDLGTETTQWTWDKVHTLEHGHPIGQVDALRSFFNVGPFPVVGTREVINNMAFGYGDSGSYNVASGPSTRRIIDFSDVENSISILPTGQSGNPFSKHYKDQAEMFINGKFRKMMMNKEEIHKNAEYVLVLTNH